MKNTIYVVGFGSGDRKYMTEQAVEVIENSDLIVGYTAYIDILKESFPHKKYISTPMKKEEERCRIAVNESLNGKNVVVVSSGDSGIYGMSGIMLEVIESMNVDIELLTVPGITSAIIASSLLGAPIMHDFSVISLSDLMTPLELIYKRVKCASESDFVICLYNPKSKKRLDYVEKASEIIMKYRSSEIPVGIVRHAGRKDEKAWLTTLGNLKNEPIDMFCVIIIGNSQTYIKNGKMITPRGYKIGENYD